MNRHPLSRALDGHVIALHCKEPADSQPGDNEWVYATRVTIQDRVDGEEADGQSRTGVGNAGIGRDAVSGQPRLPVTFLKWSLREFVRSPARGSGAYR